MSCCYCNKKIWLFQKAYKFSAKKYIHEKCTSNAYLNVPYGK